MSRTEETVTRLITRDDKSVALQVRRAQLRVSRGPDKGQKKEIELRRMVVGTSTDCDLVLTDPAVSRQHFELLPGEKEFRIRDLGSKNGTTINGLRVVEAVMSGGEDILIGKTRIRFSMLDKLDEYPISTETSFGPVLGRSLIMRRVFAVLERAAESDSTLLLEGESGTGKDLAAEAMHMFSPRREQPFIVVDCGSIQSTLAESELFGHCKGSFTGAERDRAGAFESANGGTVLLDEIGELDLTIQPKLLRALEKREVKRLGENRYRPIDVRVVAATNRDLQHEVEASRFREDLFYRLSVLRVRLPALREKREDIGPLARSFVQRLDSKLDPIEVISDQVLAMFMNHDWPGNVRELRNVVERLLLFPEKPETALITGEYSSEDSTQNLLRMPFHDARTKWNERFEKSYLAAMLDSCDGVVAHAAERAQIPRQTFHRLMTKHGLRKL